MQNKFVYKNRKTGVKVHTNEILNEDEYELVMETKGEVFSKYNKKQYGKFNR